MADRFLFDVVVRWRDVDAASEIFFPNYFSFVTDAEDELFRSCGLPQQEIIERLGVYLPRVTVHANFRSRAGWNDTLQVAIWVSDLTEKRYNLAFEITQKESGEPVSDGYIVILCIDAAKRKTCRIPDELLAFLTSLHDPASSSHA